MSTRTTKQVQHLQIGDRIATPEGPRPITTIVRNGQRFEIEVDTVDPYTFHGTATAPVFVHNA